MMGSLNWMREIVASGAQGLLDTGKMNRFSDNVEFYMSPVKCAGLRKPILDF